jgi:hypothetical protein
MSSWRLSFRWRVVMFGLQYDKIEWAVGALLVAAMAFAAFA